MQTNQALVEDQNGNAISGSEALLWGNNASWRCVNATCAELLGNRTGDGEFTVQCNCGFTYDILRSPNRNGNLNLGPAIGVRCLNL